MSISALLKLSIKSELFQESAMKRGRFAISFALFGIGAIDSYKIGPSIAMVLFQSRRVIGHWATISAVTGWEQAR